MALGLTKSRDESRDAVIAAVHANTKEDDEDDEDDKDDVGCR